MPQSSRDHFSLIMPTVDWGPTFALCLEAAQAALDGEDQLVVVFDGEPPPLPDWLQASGALLLKTGVRSGPAAARNLGACQARHPILLFVDADVALHPDAIERIREHFSADPHLEALFGSYDDSPVAPGLVSRFRNLLHHHTHTSHPGPACTFWAGCGAVRRESFLALGGFDAEAYRQPCIEDIEFGLRLHDAGGRILLDPAIEGTHHKRWTLGLMLRTDIRQRAIPWSRLLLSRRQIPSTLNLSAQSRISAALSLCVPFALLTLAIPGAGPWLLLPALAIPLLLLIVLNRSFLALLRRQGGLPLMLTGAPLLVVYLLYSSLSFAMVLIQQWVNTPLGQLRGNLLRSPHAAKGLQIVLVLLGLLALINTIRGIAFNVQAVTGTDLHQRFAEWQLFRDQIYPHARLATPEQRELSYFRTTVYLPPALPLFGMLFAWGGIWQGKITMVIASLTALYLIARVGWTSLRPWGKNAAWLGALSPLTIAGNASCLAHGQFSIVCMGFITLQWLQLQRQQPGWAGISWALAMLKPQIAASFALPFFTRRNVGGLFLGVALLLGLTAAALSHTQTSPVSLALSWIQTLPVFIHHGNANALNLLPRELRRNPVFITALITTLLIAATSIAAALRHHLLRPPQDRTGQSADSINARKPDPLILAAICGIFGMVALHHRHYDNIMLYPAILSCWRNTMLTPRLGDLSLALLISATLWTPQFVLERLPVHRELQVVIWLIVGLALTWRFLNTSRPGIQTSNGSALATHSP